ncbi:hypothetical protein COCON_G00236180 [Conger conger]|uniref:Integrase catalytic domain-containing protein n=1 Tax=Conger conger TaxID=82655 RepID=A0A9Q1HM25_CONCO|nr:hypothetical protein COCON_G00236180 [Conger conger]
MCRSTRYPEAYPLRSITTRSILKELTAFMSVFGIPKVIQSDQGSNFMSRQFAKQLKVRHGVSSAYHPQSQGVLERFHQTLKSLLRSYCVELGRDWEEGLPWLLLAIREVAQESTGFSPNELVFGHEVRGPVAAVAEEWPGTEPPENVIDYVDGFRVRLYRACAAAQRALEKAQSKMKKLFNRKTKHRSFKLGDQVLALLPLDHSPLQAKFMGPYVLDKQLSEVNYLIRTPDRRKKVQLCHINLLKPYCSRIPEPAVPPDIPVCAKSESTVVPVSAVCSVVTSPFSPVREPIAVEDFQIPGEGLLRGRLENSAYLRTLKSKFDYLTKEQRDDLVQLIGSYTCLFPDAPTRTNVLTHDIEVVAEKPIKQRFYRVPLPKKIKIWIRKSNIW